MIDKLKEFKKYYRNQWIKFLDSNILNYNKLDKHKRSNNLNIFLSWLTTFKKQCLLSYAIFLKKKMSKELNRIKMAPRNTVVI